MCPLTVALRRRPVLSALLDIYVGRALFGWRLRLRSRRRPLGPRSLTPAASNVSASEAWDRCRESRMAARAVLGVKIPPRGVRRYEQGHLASVTCITPRTRLSAGMQPRVTPCLRGRHAR